MRETVFRVVAGVLTLLMVWLLPAVGRMAWERGIGSSEFTALIGLLLAGPTFAVYALKGDRAAYKVLLPGLALVHLPQALLETLIRRNVVLPEEVEGVVASEESGGGLDRLGGEDDSGDGAQRAPTEDSAGPTV